MADYDLSTDIAVPEITEEQRNRAIMRMLNYANGDKELVERLSFIMGFRKDPEAIPWVDSRNLNKSQRYKLRQKGSLREAQSD